MNRPSGRRAQGMAIIALGVVVIVVAVLVWAGDQDLDAYAASKEPFIAALGVLAIAGGILRLLGKIGN